MNQIVIGSFFGDEGKGQTVHNLCKILPKEDTIVVRFSGGHQVGHTVRHGSLEHKFSNYGSGTLLGIPTYWSNYCTVDPLTAMLELEDLNRLGIAPCIIYHPLCEVITPFDVVTQWNDGKNLRHGTVGTGFKSALDRVANGYHLMVCDCLDIMVLRAKIASMVANYYDFDTQLPMLNIDEWCIKVHGYFKSVTVRGEDCLHEYGHRVFEGSQGILLDQRFGVMPYCTPSNTTCQNAMEIIRRLGEDEAEHLYVMRPYITRHGSGPIPTCKPVREVIDPNNTFNEFQKTLRATEFDLSLLKHSIHIDSMFYNGSNRSLVITHKDEMPESFLEQFSKDCLGNIRLSYYDNLIYMGRI